MKSYLHLFLLAMATQIGIAGASADDWGQFRGPNASGVSTGKLLAKWSPTENLAWKTEMPGFGSSSPIVFGSKAYVTCYSGYGIDAKEPGNVGDLTRHLVCVDLNSGKIDWKTDIKSIAEEDPYTGFITEHGYASSTPATDGKNIFAFFGKSGVYAFDMQGKELWHKELGNFSDPAKWGDGSSPILVDDLVVINAGIVGHAIVALKKTTGEVAWRIDDEKFTNCWSTPVLVTTPTRTEMVFSMPGKIFGLNPADGKIWWTSKSPLADTVCASLTVHNDMVIAMGGRGGQAAAIRCGGDGDVSESHLVWQTPLRAGIGTPVCVAGKLFWYSSGMVVCANAVDGKEIFKERLGAAPAAQGERRGPQADYASPIVVGDKIVLVGRNGTSAVLNVADKLDIISQNSLGDDNGLFNATPAFADDKLLIRSNNNLYCVGAKK